MLSFHCPSCGKLNRVEADKLGAGPKCGACQTALDVDNHPFYVSDDALDALVAASPVPVLVDFYADWCPPCRAIAPTLEALAKKYSGRVLIAKVDTEKHQRNAAKLRVSGIPALFVFKGGKVVAETAGAQRLPAFEQLIQPHL